MPIERRLTSPSMDRPDPDALLRQISGERDAQSRGALRIYFGASAGVGKTYAMLAAAQAARANGADVLAGVVHTHGRRETEDLLAGLPLLPPKTYIDQGNARQAFDLDAALARRPQILLIDELAHTNAPGSRHAKRWQDVQEACDAGIDVWTTLNAQHLESLTNAVSSITGIQVWETVPDAIFDDADEIILIDLPADELLRRLRAGKVYLPDQAQVAMRHFFRKGNLIALRELALRRTADHVDDDVRRWRSQRRVEAVWQTRDAILACVGAQRDAEYIVRNAHRLAQQLDCHLHVVTIARARIVAETPRGQDAIHAALALAESLGARTERLAGADMVTAVSHYVRRHNITKVVLGRDSPPVGLAAARLLAWSQRLMSSASVFRRTRFADALTRACPGLDVVQLARPSVPANASAAAPEPLASTPSLSARAQSPRTGYLWALCYCAVAACIAGLVTPALHQTNVVMFFLVAVVVAALRHGRGPSALVSLASVAVFDWFFVPPYQSFAVSDIQYVVTFAVLLAVGLIVGQLTAGLRAQAHASAARENDVQGLYEFARELSSALATEQIASTTTAFVRAAFSVDCRLYVLDADDHLQAVAPAAPVDPHPDNAVAAWVLAHHQAAGAGTQTLARQRWLYLPLKAPMRTRGVLALHADVRGGAIARSPLAQAYTTLVAIALERVHYVDVARQAVVSIESERLRNALLSAISHDLRTPLTSLVGMSDTLLRDADTLSPHQRQTVHALRAQAQRMHAMVVNLLDMARLQARHMPIALHWQSLEEIVGAALGDCAEALVQHRVHVGPMSHIPLVRCDAALIERVLCNLLENAAKYAPPHTAIDIDASVAPGGQAVSLSVSDQGPGIAAHDAGRIFEKFTRLDAESSVAGVGLGLAVCAAIMEMHHGRISYSPRAAGQPGAQFTFSLPLPAEPPTAPESALS